MKITKYNISSDKITKDITVACVSDLHARSPKKVLSALSSVSPDYILLAGDIFEVANEFMKDRNASSFAFLESALKIAPIYYCYGNHEIYFTHDRRKFNRLPDDKMAEEYIRIISDMGVNLVNDSYLEIPGENKSFFVGGLVCGRDKNPAFAEEFDSKFLENFSNEKGFKILLCHYPHYYEKHLKETDFDIILSGHAHGGQWRIFNRGVFAPHQGLFPKYTSGMRDGRFIISTGAANNSKPIPRFFNPTEILEIKISKKEEMR